MNKNPKKVVVFYTKLNPMPEIGIGPNGATGVYSADSGFHAIKHMFDGEAEVFHASSLDDKCCEGAADVYVVGYVGPRYEFKPNDSLELIGAIKKNIPGSRIVAMHIAGSQLGHRDYRKAGADKVLQIPLEVIADAYNGKIPEDSLDYHAGLWGVYNLTKIISSR